MSSRKSLKISRVTISLLLGAAIGATIYCVQYLIDLYQNLGAEHFYEYGISKGIKIFILVFLIWLMALCTFGGAAWLFLHKTNRTHWFFAFTSGFVIPLVVVLCMETSGFTGRSSENFSFYANGGYHWVEGKLTLFGWKMAFLMALEFAAIGAIVAMVIWFINYRVWKRN